MLFLPMSFKPIKEEKNKIFFKFHWWLLAFASKRRLIGMIKQTSFLERGIIPLYDQEFLILERRSEAFDRFIASSMYISHFISYFCFLNLKIPTKLSFSSIF